jgi:hypothetical protein
MGLWDVGMADIVDLDGQLLAIDAEVIETTSLLQRARKAGGEWLWLVHDGERMPLHSRQLIRLARDKVVFPRNQVTPSSVQLKPLSVLDGASITNHKAAGRLSNAKPKRSSA